MHPLALFLLPVFVFGCWPCGLARAQAPSAAAAAESLRLPDGLEASLFAAEPLLSSPSDIDVDARGTVWVCEVINYRAKKDTRKEGDRILVLEDTDGDGGVRINFVMEYGNHGYVDERSGAGY